MNSITAAEEAMPMPSSTCRPKAAQPTGAPFVTGISADIAKMLGKSAAEMAGGP